MKPRKARANGAHGKGDCFQPGRLPANEKIPFSKFVHDSRDSRAHPESAQSGHPFDADVVLHLGAAA